MIRLMKMELYRLMYSGNIVLILIMGAVGIAFLPLMDAGAYYDSFLKVSGSAYMGLMVSGGIGVTSYVYPLFLIFIIGLFMEKELRNRTCYYEIIYEKSKAKVILSKTIILSLVISIVVMLPIIIVFVILSIKNGYTDNICGEMFAGHMVVRMLALYIISLHITAVTVLASLILRSGTRGLIYGFIRYFVWNFIWIIFYSGWNGVIRIISMFCEPVSSMSCVASGVDKQYYPLLVIIPIISLIVNVGVLYIIAYVVSKKVDYR